MPEQKSNPSKIAIRKEIMATRNRLSPSECIKLGDLAAERLLTLDQYNKARCVMTYMDFRNETPTRQMLRNLFASGKTAVLPYVDNDFRIIPYIVQSFHQFRKGILGIWEPDIEVCHQADPDSIELVIVPGLAFDLKGNRLGYGKGCYDGFLPTLPRRTPKIGLCYDFQILPSVPSASGDVKMDHLLTPSSYHRIDRR